MDYEEIISTPHPEKSQTSSFEYTPLLIGLYYAILLVNGEGDSMMIYNMRYTEKTYEQFFYNSIIPTKLEFPPVDYYQYDAFLLALGELTEICVEYHEVFFSQEIRDSLALFSIWRSGVSGTTQDPFTLNSDDRLAQKRVLLHSGYREMRIISSKEYFEMMPMLDELASLMSNGEMLHSMFQHKMNQTDHGETYGHIDRKIVDSFWGNIPKAIFNDEAAFELSGDCLIDGFLPEQIHKIFAQNGTLKEIYGVHVFENLPDYIPARRIEHPDTEERDLRLYPDTTWGREPLTLHKRQIYNPGFALWVLSALQIQYSWFLSESFAAVG